MQWARRQHRTRRYQKKFKTTLFAVLVSVFLFTSLLIPFLSPTAAAATPASSSTVARITDSANITVLAAEDSTPSIDPCDATGFNLSWVICPIVNMISGATMVMQGIINRLMEVDVTGIFDKDHEDSAKAYYAAWNSFRVFGIALIIIAGLIMVISQAMGMEIFDAYTIKRVLPRMLVAIIGISLSWWLMKFLAEFTNDVGVGIRSVIYYPFKGLIENGTGIQSLGSSLIESMIGAGGFLLLGIGGVLSLLATAALAALVAFLVLIARQIVITFLILLAPIAIACYVLPNTEKAYKLWWDSLSKGLMMFPIISAFIAAGQVFSVVAGSNTSTNYGISNVVAILAYFLPYFALPFTFRLAGGALATLGGLANDRGRGGFDRLKKYRADQTERRLGHYGQQIGDRTLQARAEAVRRLNSSASRRGKLAGGAMRFAGRQVAGLGGIEHRMSAINARTSKEINDEIATGRDDRIRGLTVDQSMGWERAKAAGLAQTTSNGTRQWKSLGGRWIDEADVVEGQKRWGHDVAAQQAALSYEMRKANSEAEVQGISSRYHSLATNQWGQTDNQAGGSWIGASFENQNQHLEYKNTDWTTGNLRVDRETGLAGSGLVDETYEKRGSYNLAQMGSNTIEQLKVAHQSAESVLADASASQEAKALAQDQKEKIAAIAETFMHQYGGVGGDEENLAAMQAEAAGREGAGRSPVRQTNTPGAAHTAERVRELAQLTGVYTSAPAGGYSYPVGRSSGTSGQNRREQG